MAKPRTPGRGRGNPGKPDLVTKCLLVGRVVAWDRRGKDGSRGKGSFKGTHARDFHSPFLNFFLHISVTNR